ncbi:MAG: CapA family protein [Desulfobulbaceae bacterium]|nr:CapA family protein [Desulfobulbaceae bacterium]
MKSDDNIDIFFLGDTYFGEWHMRLRARKGQYDVLAQKGYLHFARAFNPLLRGGDLVIANLECAITDIPVSPFEKEKGHTYAAKRDKTIEALKASNISAVTLANNHAVDYGKAGLIDTLEALEESNIDYIGGGRTISQAAAPLFFIGEAGGRKTEIAVISCYNYGKKSNSYGFYASKKVPGVYAMDVARLQQQITDLHNNNPALMVIVMPHWGPNYTWRTFTQQKMAQQIVRAGADLIVGHSAHMMQEVEYINNRVVLYSIGNFIMNGNGEFKRRNLPPYSFITRLRITADKQQNLRKTILLYPFISDNLGTDFTPRFVNEQEFSQVQAILRSHNFNPEIFDSNARSGKDDYGHFIEYLIPTNPA